MHIATNVCSCSIVVAESGKGGVARNEGKEGDDEREQWGEGERGLKFFFFGCLIQKIILKNTLSFFDLNFIQRHRGTIGRFSECQ